MKKAEKKRYTRKGIFFIKTFIVLFILSLGAGVSHLIKTRIPESMSTSTVKSKAKKLPESVPVLTKKNKAETANHLITVPFIQQMPELERGCEVTSLAMLLNFAGKDVSKMELAEKIDRVPFNDEGFRGNMNEGFLGDIYSFKKPGLGVYVQPIIKLANQYLPGRIIDLTSKPAEELYEMIDKGTPVWVITNARFKKLPESEFRTFQTKKGPMKVTYQEHSVVMTGYDDDYVYINDPLANRPNRKVSKKNFEDAWIQMGRQAISICIQP